jgi:hypothetical protein
MALSNNDYQKRYHEFRPRSGDWGKTRNGYINVISLALAELEQNLTEPKISLGMDWFCSANLMSNRIYPQNLWINLSSIRHNIV